MHRDLTSGPITRTMLLFALPMTAGNLLQQLYNLVAPSSWGVFSAPAPWRRWGRPIPL